MCTVGQFHVWLLSFSLVHNLFICETFYRIYAQNRVKCEVGLRLAGKIVMNSTCHALTTIISVVFLLR